MSSSTLRVGVLAGACLLGLTCCADPDTTEGGRESAAELPRVATDPEVQRLVPDAVAKKGSVVFATSAPSAPTVYFTEDNKTLTGYTIDLGNAIGDAMGLDVEWKNISFDSALPGLAAGKYDAAMASFSIERERLQTVDFVSYYLSGGGFLVKSGSGIRVNSFEGTCGYRVAVKKGASQLDALSNASEGCAAHGAKPIDILQVPTDNALALALISDRADIGVADKPQAFYIADQSNHQLCVSSNYQTSHSIAGIAVPKGSKLRGALQAAVNSLLKSGAYQKISRVWDTGTPTGTTLTKQYQKLAKPWGIGPDGTVTTSKIFTDPQQIPADDKYFYQPIREGCA